MEKINHANKALRFMSDLVIYNKYANYLPELGRRQTWEECVDEVVAMHKRKYPHVHDDIDFAFKYVYDKKVMPSMRSIQYGGLPIELNNCRMYNCAYTLIDHPFSFAEVFFMLLSGTGVGYSVRKRHVKKLPPIVLPQGERRFLVGDSLEGWADSVRQLIYAYMKGKERPRFDYRDVRPKGSPIKKSGGVAPGSAKLEKAHKMVEAVLKQAIGRRLTTLECHDIVCYISDCVLAGGRRDSACIALFDYDDTDMMTCKSVYKVKDVKVVDTYVDGDDFGSIVSYAFEDIQNGSMNTNVYGANNTARISQKYGDYDLTESMVNGVMPWYYIHSHRGRANNSIAFRRGNIKKKQFMDAFETIKINGEPAFILINDDDSGLNPCVEAGLRPHQFCNLESEVVYDITTQAELNSRTRATAIIGTLQAGYTDFHYLRAVWRETTEKEALLGMSMTGISSGTILNLNLVEAAEIAVNTNVEMADKIGINRAARVTLLKPEGSGSLAMSVLGSGIHAWHAKYTLRSVRINKSEPLYEYLLGIMPDFVESDILNMDKAVVSIPLEAPEGIILRDEPVMNLLNRIKRFSDEWVKPGHIDGVDTHNVSATVSVKPDEWDRVSEWMWDNQQSYNGLSLMPYSGGNYKQAPFIEITKKVYEEMIAKFPIDFDFTKIVENTSVNHSLNAACAGGACEL